MRDCPKACIMTGQMSLCSGNGKAWKTIFGDILRCVFIKCASSVHLLHKTAWEIFWGEVHGTINRGETAENGFLNAHVCSTIPATYHTIYVRTSILYQRNHTIPYQMSKMVSKCTWCVQTIPYDTICPKIYVAAHPVKPFTFQLQLDCCQLSCVTMQWNVTIWNHEWWRNKQIL